MYPQELHELHNDCPSAPEKAEIKKNMLSTYCEKTAKKKTKTKNTSTGRIKNLIG